MCSKTPGELPALTVIVGHYGSGKTNLALNLACALAGVGALPKQPPFAETPPLVKPSSLPKPPALTSAPLLIDLDIVNPYYRSTDFAALCAHTGIELTGPVFGASNLDAPSLAPGLDSRIREASLERPVIVDVGGDPDGARALARFAPALAQHPDALVLYVVNLKRPETATVQHNLELINDIERASHVRITALAGNTHLQEHTSAELICASYTTLAELAGASQRPLRFIAAPQSCIEACAVQQPPAPLFAIQRYVKNVWE